MKQCRLGCRFERSEHRSGSIVATARLRRLAGGLIFGSLVSTTIFGASCLGDKKERREIDYDSCFCISMTMALCELDDTEELVELECLNGCGAGGGCVSADRFCVDEERRLGGCIEWTGPASAVPTTYVGVSTVGHAENEYTVYFGADDEKLYAVTETGEVDWQYGADGIIFTGPMIHPDTGDVYVGTDGGSLIALSQQGSVLWTVSFPERVRSTVGYEEGVGLFVAAVDGTVFEVDFDGNIIWEMTLSPFAESLSPEDIEMVFVTHTGERVSLSAISEEELYHYVLDLETEMLIWGHHYNQLKEFDLDPTHGGIFVLTASDVLEYWVDGEEDPSFRVRLNDYTSTGSAEKFTLDANRDRYIVLMDNDQLWRIEPSEDGSRPATVEKASLASAPAGSDRRFVFRFGTDRLQIGGESAYAVLDPDWNGYASMAELEFGVSLGSSSYCNLPLWSCGVSGLDDTAFLPTSEGVFAYRWRR